MKTNFYVSILNIKKSALDTTEKLFISIFIFIFNFFYFFYFHFPIFLFFHLSLLFFHFDKCLNIQGNGDESIQFQIGGVYDY